MITLANVRELDTQLQARGEVLSANKLVAHLGGSKRDALAVLQAYRAAPLLEAQARGRQGMRTDIPQNSAESPAFGQARDAVADLAQEPPSEQPLCLCFRCGYSAWFEWTPGDWRCRLCGIPPATT
jgi:hypothetical protein